MEAITVRRAHVMPFGTEIGPDGVLFRLWAPGAGSVDLALESGDGGCRLTLMAAAGGGWYRLLSPRAGPGSRYRFRIDGGLLVPDPASRCQVDDVHGPSLVVDPRAFLWHDGGWQGRPWEEAVLYELHPGAFAPGGGFSGVIERLDYLAGLGVTAIELMPVADFPGGRNWGYDGVLPFAPDRSYGAPDDLKRLVEAAHARGLMVLLDVVYNHFGPEGNYLHVYAREAFFDESRQTPWGAAIDFDGAMSATVRRYFIDNALYWLEEYHLDGLRLDAVHAIRDDSSPDILEAIAHAVRHGPGRDRHIHLVLENDGNQARYLGRDPIDACRLYDAQWNDDLHHCCHVLVTGESEGYYRDYADRPLQLLGRCLAEGFAYQGEASAYRGGCPRGEPSRDLAPTAFVAFLQNHDQVGNRAFGERLGLLAPASLLSIAAALVLLAPSPPLLFMGEEFGATTPFLYFCDFGPDLAGRVRDGRRREFGRFPRFAEGQAQARIPDPTDVETFRRSCLDWRQAESDAGRRTLALYRRLLEVRRREIVPRLGDIRPGGAGYTWLGVGGLQVRWPLAEAGWLEVVVNFSEEPLPRSGAGEGRVLFALPAEAGAGAELPPLSIVWRLVNDEGEADAG